MEFKKYIASYLIGHRLHFKCNCIMNLDFIGTIKDFEIVDNEIIYIIDINGKVIRIGENHPNLIVEEV